MTYNDKSYTIYLISVEEVWGSVVLDYFFLLLLSEPSMVPSNIKATNRSSTAIYVEWSPIPQQFIHGILLGYNIIYTTKAFGDVSTGVHVTKAGSTSTLIQDLLKFSNYSIQVSGFTAKGDGPLSQEVFVRTDEDCK